MYKTLKKTLASANAEPLSATSLKCVRALIQPERSNAGKVMIGDSNVSSTQGMELIKPVASVQSPPLELLGKYGNDVDLGQVYAIGTQADIVNIYYDEF